MSGCYFKFIVWARVTSAHRHTYLCKSLSVSFSDTRTHARTHSHTRTLTKCSVSPMAKSFPFTRVAQEFSSCFSGILRDAIEFMSGILCGHRSYLAHSDSHHNRWIETHFSAFATIISDIFVVCVSGLSP